jgi:hypothetical protein
MFIFLPRTHAGGLVFNCSEMQCSIIMFLLSANVWVFDHKFLLVVSDLTGISIEKFVVIAN